MSATRGRATPGCAPPRPDCRRMSVFSSSVVATVDSRVGHQEPPAVRRISISTIWQITWSVRKPWRRRAPPSSAREWRSAPSSAPARPRANLGHGGRRDLVALGGQDAHAVQVEFIAEPLPGFRFWTDQQRMTQPRSCARWPEPRSRWNPAAPATTIGTGGIFRRPGVSSSNVGREA